MTKPSVLILHASGTNRDEEAARAIGLAGGAATILHMNRLRSGAARMRDFDALLLPGGFSYGDALGAGARMALDLEVYFKQEIEQFIASGKPVLGICNGFQTLVKAGLLPEKGLAPRRVTLAANARGHFESRWVYLRAEASRATWLRFDDLIFCPVAHGEGNVQVADADALAALEAEGLVTFRYVDANGEPAAGRYPVNPNGSVSDIAGLCNRQGNVVGLMPHPEDHSMAIQNPLGVRSGARLGLPLFVQFVEAARAGGSADAASRIPTSMATGAAA